MRTIQSALLPAALCMIALIGCRDDSRTIRPADPWPVEPHHNTPDGGNAYNDSTAVEVLYRKALRERDAGKPTDARITVGQVLHRDRWHVPAHELTQDIEVAEGLERSCYERYRELYGEHPDRAEALYLFLRIRLHSTKSVKPSKPRRSISPEQEQQLYQEALSAAYAGRSIAARAKLKKLLDGSRLHIAGNRLWQDLTLEAADDYQSTWQELTAEYHELLRDHEINGDAYYLYERIASAGPDRDAEVSDSLARYAREIAAAPDYPGYWRYYGLGATAMEAASLVDDSRTDADDQTRAYLKLSELAYTITLGSENLLAEAYHGRSLARRALGESRDAIADLRLAKDFSSPPSQEVLLDLASLLMDADGSEDALQEAVDVLLTGIQRYPKDPSFPQLLGAVHEERDAVQEAIAAYSSAINLLPEQGPDAELRSKLSARVASLQAKLDAQQAPELVQPEDVNGE